VLFTQRTERVVPSFEALVMSFESAPRAGPHIGRVQGFKANVALLHFKEEEKKIYSINSMKKKVILLFSQKLIQKKTIETICNTNNFHLHFSLFDTIWAKENAPILGYE